VSILLKLEGISSGYQDAKVLYDVSLTVEAGEIVAVVGANGAGKSTLLRTIAGLIRSRSGRIIFDGCDLAGTPAHEIVARQLIMVPEGGRIFPFMTVRENLELGAFNRVARPESKRSMEEVFALFPILAERQTQLAGLLSGGERTMCAIARAVMSRPRLLMLDEPSLGLSPLMVERVLDMITSLARDLAITIVLVEQNVHAALAMAARAYVIERGRIVKTGTGDALLADDDVRSAYLGI